MEHHLSLIKSNNLEISGDVSQIKDAIIGSLYSGGKGLIHAIEATNKRLDPLEDDMAILKENMSILKWIAGSVGTLIFALILYIITK